MTYGSDRDPVFGAVGAFDAGYNPGAVLSLGAYGLDRGRSRVVFSMDRNGEPRNDIWCARARSPPACLVQLGPDVVVFVVCAGRSFDLNTLQWAVIHGEPGVEPTPTARPPAKSAVSLHVSFAKSVLVASRGSEPSSVPLACCLSVGSRPAPSSFRGTSASPSWTSAAPCGRWAASILTARVRHSWLLLHCEV